MLTVEQAAAELGVSSPFLSRNLLDDGAISFHMVGPDKHILRKDLEDYKAERLRRERILAEMIQENQELGFYDD